MCIRDRSCWSAFCRGRGRPGAAATVLLGPGNGMVWVRPGHLVAPTHLQGAFLLLLPPSSEAG
eukprot:5454457-Pyramimonas_sp.AAC.1